MTTANVNTPAFPAPRVVREMGGFTLEHLEGCGFTINSPKDFPATMFVAGGYDPEEKMIKYTVDVIATERVIKDADDIKDMADKLDDALYVAQYFETQLNYGDWRTELADVA